jgi:hypothetical protein
MARVFNFPVTHCGGLVWLLLLREVHRDACGGSVVRAVAGKNMRQTADGNVGAMAR